MPAFTVYCGVVIVYPCWWTGKGHGRSGAWWTSNHSPELKSDRRWECVTPSQMIIKETRFINNVERIWHPVARSKVFMMLQEVMWWNRIKLPCQKRKCSCLIADIIFPYEFKKQDKNRRRDPGPDGHSTVLISGWVANVIVDVDPLSSATLPLVWFHEIHYLAINFSLCFDHFLTFSE